MSLSQWLIYEDGRGGAISYGFEIILTDSGDPHGFIFGTSEISNHTTGWDFGDGATASCPAMDTVQHTYAGPGTYDVTATCHGVSESVTVDTADPPVSALLLDSIEPAEVPIGGVIRVALRGAGFAAPMLVRTWDVSTLMGSWDAQVITDDTATVDIDTTGWPEGTGGIDVVVNGAFSNQLQFPVVA